METTLPAHEREGIDLGGEGTGGGGLTGSFRALDRLLASLAVRGLFWLGTTAFLGILTYQGRRDVKKGGKNGEKTKKGVGDDRGRQL